MPSRDTQWVIGVIIGAAIALSVQITGVRTDLRRMDDRLRAVEHRLDAIANAAAAKP